MENKNLSDFERYLNARPLDVHTWSDHHEVNLFVNDIYIPNFHRSKAMNGSTRNC